MRIYHVRPSAQCPHDSVTLEQCIDAELRHLISASDRVIRLAAWRRMIDLIGARTLAAIAQMEKKRGLQVPA